MARHGEQWVYFGDGNVAKFDKKVSYEKSDGTRWVRFIIRPTEAIVQQYNLDDNEKYREYGMVIKDYLEATVVTLLQRADITKVLITVSFDGTETTLSRRDAHLIELINNAETLIKSLKLSNVRLNQEFRKMSTQLREHMRDNVDLVMEARKASAHTSKMDDDEYAEIGGE